jgi:ABC-type amino acid transport substrate-binding protein
MTPRFLCVLIAVAALAGVKPAVAQQPPAQPRAIPTDLVLKPVKGDFDVMLERRRVRVLAPYSRTFFFNEMGRERGYSADLVRVVEKYLNTTLGKQLGNRPLTFLIIPTTRDKLLTGVVEGLGDIAVNVAVSDERKRLVDFILAPDAPPLAEVVLTGPTSPLIKTVDDLAGQTVHARPSSVYHEDLVALN